MPFSQRNESEGRLGPISDVYPTHSDYVPGDLIGERYVIVDQIAREGDEAVFSCCDEVTGQQVAIKVSRGTPERLQQAKSEFRMLHEAAPPGAPQLYSLHVSEGSTFMVMELRDGVDYTKFLSSGGIPAILGGESGFDGPSSGPAAKSLRQQSGFPDQRVSPLVGRAEELARLRAASHRSCQESGQVVVLWGASGMGKTRLLDEHAAQWRARGDWVLQGRCHPSEFMPFASLDGVIEALRASLAQLPPAQRRLLADDNFDVLVQAFPVLQGLIGSPARRELAAGYNVRQVGQAFRNLLLRLVRDRPIALLVDDVHWGDSDGLRVLSRVWSGPLPQGLFIGIALRDEGELVPELRQELSGVPFLEQITLGPLDGASCAALARQTGALVGEEEAIELAKLGEGNPNWVIRLAQATSGREVRPQSIGEAIHARLATLTFGGRSLLALVAIAGGPLPLEVARRAFGRDLDFQHEVGVLRERGLLVTHCTSQGDVALDVDHDSTRVALLQGLEADEEKALLRRLARAVEDERHTASVPIAEYHLGAGDSHQAAKSALKAAARAKEQLAFGRAARLYDIALRHGSREPSERCLCLRHLGESLVGAGQGLRGAERLIEGADIAPSTGESIKLRALAVEHLFRCAEHQRGLEQLELLLATMKLPLRKFQPAVLASLMGLRAKLWFMRKRSARRSKIAREISAQERLRMEVVWSLGVGLSFYEPLQAFVLQARHAVLAEQSQSVEDLVLSRSTEALILAWEGDEKKLPMSRKFMETAEELVDGVRNAQVRAHMYLMAAGIASVDERHQEVLALTETGVAYCRTSCPQARWEAAQLAVMHGTALLYTGRLPELVTWLSAALEEVEQTEDALALLLFRTGFCSLAWLAAGMPDRLEEELRKGERAPLRGNYRYRQLWAQVAHALATGQAERACRLAEDAYRTCRADFLFRLRPIRIEMHDLRARCALTLAARSDNRALLPLVHASIKQLKRERGDWPAGLAAANEGLLALQEARPEVASQKLTEAKGCFERSGMALYVLAAEMRLAQLEGRDFAPPEEWSCWLADGGTERLPGLVDAIIAPLASTALP